MKNNEQLYVSAEKFVGTKCPECKKYCGLASSAPYCAAFVTYIFHLGDASSLFYGGKKVVYVPSALSWCRANLAQIPAYLAMPMDIVVFDWNLNGTGDHIGFVRKRKDAGEVYTIEGNTNGGIVAKRTRPVKYITGIFRPMFPCTYKDGTLEIDGQFGYSSIAMLQKALGRTVNGKLTKADVKALQKKFGVTQDGSWGTQTSKAIQKALKITVDGYFGENSVKALQKWINEQNKATNTQKPAEPVKAAYSGTYPTLNKIVSKTNNREKLYKMAYTLAYQTSTSTAKYPSGQPKAAYKTALDKLPLSKHKWNKAAKAGASCDVFVWTCVLTAGIDKNFPSGLWKQLSYMQKNLTSVKPSDAKAGDIGFYRKDVKGKHGHVFIFGEGNNILEASYNEYYPKTTKSRATRISTKNKKYVYAFRFKDTESTTYSAMMKDNAGTNVKNLQKYLNWYFKPKYGKDVLAVDGNFGTMTEKYLMLFQSEQGLATDGYCGEKTIAKMKAVKL